MKVRYRPGGPNSTVGNTYTVEVIRFRTIEDDMVKYPMLKEVLIKYQDGKTEWVNGLKFLNGLDNLKRGAVDKQIK